jgi:hypothetical protein
LGNEEKEKTIRETDLWLIAGAGVIQTGGPVKGDINPILVGLEKNLGPNWVQIVKEQLNGQTPV